MPVAIAAISTAFAGFYATVS